MTTEAATRTFLRDVIGLSNNNDGTRKANAIIAEGLDDLADLHELSEDDGIKTLCANVRNHQLLYPTQTGKNQSQILAMPRRL